MAKSTYFALAVTVAGLAFIAYLLLNDNLVQQVVEPDERNLKSQQEDVERTKPGRPMDDTTQSKTKNHKNDKPIEAVKDGKLEDKVNSGERSNLKPPPGHLKKLGEHGAPVIENFVEELDYVLYGKDFYKHFIRKRTPVVIRGAAKGWPAFHHWSNETYLKTKYGNEQFDVEFTKKYENMPPVKKTMSLKEFLEIYKKEEVYLDSPIPHSAMTQDIIVPPCLQCKELLTNIESVHLLYSNGGTSSSLHYDGYENLLTLFSGRKEVLLIHYNNSKYLVSDPDHKKYQSYEGLASLDPEAVDLLAFPYLSNITLYKVQPQQKWKTGFIEN